MTIRRRQRELDQDVLDEISRLVRNPEQLTAAEIGRRMRGDALFVGKILPETRTMERIVAGIRGRLTQLDKEFEWHKLEDYDLPWEACSFLLPMWSWVKESGPFPTRGFHFPSPSAREVRWWWRIHLVDLELDYMWVWTIAQWFVARELIHDLLDGPLELADLEAYLAYRPWRKDNLAIYRRAVEDGRIPVVKPTPGWSDAGEWIRDFPINETTEYTQLPRGIAFGIAGNPDSLFPNWDDDEQEDEQ